MLKDIVPDLHYHFEPDAGHWWDKNPAPGADCVDWPDLFDLFANRKLDPHELEFDFLTPSPYVNPRHSFVTILTEQSPYQDCRIVSVKQGDDTLKLTTSNVKAMELDGDALLEKGIGHIVVDVQDMDVTGGKMVVGTPGLKRGMMHGPANQVFQRPFCFIYPDGDNPFARYVAFLVSAWDILGNGYACALPVSRLEDVEGGYNLVYVGVQQDYVPLPDGIPFSWSETDLQVGPKEMSSGVLLFVFPEGEHLSMVITATQDATPLLYWYMPFSSRAGMPDYAAWDEHGGVLAGFFDPDFQFDESLGYGF